MPTEFVSPVALEFHRIWHQYECMLESFTAGATHLSTYPQPFTASASFATAHTPWYLDYGHLTFWFFFFSTGVIVLWLAFAYVSLTKNTESRRLVRETRGYSRAQTGDTMTAVLPLTWSVTMLAHAGTHSSNFDENTNATLFSFTVIAYQWGWNYYFPREIAELLSNAPRIVGRGHLIPGQACDPYAQLLARVRHDYLAQLTLSGRYVAKHGRYTASSALQLLLPSASGDIPTWALASLGAVPTPTVSGGETTLLRGHRGQARLQADTFTALIQLRQQRSRLSARLLANFAQKQDGAVIAPTLSSALMPYGLLSLEAEPCPVAQVSQGQRAAVSCAWVGNRLAMIHAHLAEGVVHVANLELANESSALVAQLKRVESFSNEPEKLLMAANVTVANIGLAGGNVSMENNVTWAPTSVNALILNELRGSQVTLTTPVQASFASIAIESPLVTQRAQTITRLGLAASNWANEGYGRAQNQIRFWQTQLRGSVSLAVMGGAETSLTGADFQANTGNAAAAADLLERRFGKSRLAYAWRRRLAKLTLPVAVEFHLRRLRQRTLELSGTTLTPANGLSAVTSKQVSEDPRTSQHIVPNGQRRLSGWAAQDLLQTELLTTVSQPKLDVRKVIFFKLGSSLLSLQLTQKQPIHPRMLSFIEIVSQLPLGQCTDILAHAGAVLAHAGTVLAHTGAITLSAEMRDCLHVDLLVSRLQGMFPIEEFLARMYETRILTLIRRSLMSVIFSPSGKIGHVGAWPTQLTLLMPTFAPISIRSADMSLMGLRGVWDTRDVLGCPTTFGLSGLLAFSADSAISKIQNAQPTSITTWQEGASDTQPTRLTAVSEGEITQINARNEAAMVSLVAQQNSTFSAWRTLWLWQTATAGFPWDRNFRAQLARRPATGVVQSWGSTSTATAQDTLALQRSRFDKNAATMLLPRNERTSVAVWPTETGRAALDTERGTLLPLWAVTLPTPHVDIDATFVHTRWAAEVNTSRRSDHDARFKVLWGPVAAIWAAQAANPVAVTNWTAAAGPSFSSSLGAKIYRELSLLAQGELTTTAVDSSLRGAKLAISTCAPFGSLASPTSDLIGGKQLIGATASAFVRHLTQRMGVVAWSNSVKSNHFTLGLWSQLWVHAPQHARSGGQLGMAGSGDAEIYWLTRLIGHLEVFNAHLQLHSYRVGGDALAAEFLQPSACHPLAVLLAPVASEPSMGGHNDKLPQPYIPRTGYMLIDSNISAQRRLRVTKGVYLPADVPMHGIFGSKDVIHSWAIPGLGVKIDCIPGYSSHRRLVLRWRGLYWGQCMEVCGRYHHWMPILVRVVHKDVFLLWCLAYLRLITLRAASEATTLNITAARAVWAVASQAQVASLPAGVLAISPE